MGTFHDTADPLHGITVVATAGDTVYVGRCHERDAEHVVLVDVDQHTAGEDGRTNGEYLERAAKFGVWNKHERLVLPAAEVTGLVPLAEYFRSPAGTTASTPPPAAHPTPPAAAGRPAPDAPVTLTDTARDEVKRLLAAETESGLGLRLGVAGGGCSGLVYRIEFAAPRADDIILPQKGFDVLMDRKSAVYLRGVVLDHQRGLGGKGFQFRNPNASNTCGCGESFAV
jgi:iron-sulfur cluster assembly protein